MMILNFITTINHRVQERSRSLLSIFKTSKDPGKQTCTPLQDEEEEENEIASPSSLETVACIYIQAQPYFHHHPLLKLWNQSAAKILHDENQPLKDIFIECCLIRSSQARALGCGLKRVQRKISMEDCNLKSVFTLKQLAMGLTSNQSIEEISIKSCCIKRGGIGIITEALKTNHSLKTFILHDTYEANGDSDAENLAILLKTNSSLQKIGLSWNNVGCRGAAQLAAGLKLNVSLKDIDLSYNCKIGDYGAGKLSDALKVNQSLQTINLTRNGIGNDGSEKLAEALKVNRSIHSIILTANIIGDFGAEMLAGALKENQTLRKIDLNGNKIGDVGTDKLADALKVNQTLQDIGLGDNNVGLDGALKLADALKLNRSLLTIDLKKNDIGGIGVLEFAKAMEVNESLKAIDLESTYTDVPCNENGVIASSLILSRSLQKINLGCFLTSAGEVWMLAEALKNNHILLSLGLKGNNIDCHRASVLAEALMANKTLQEIDLGYNKIGDYGAEKFGEVLEVNHSLRVIDLQFNFIGDEGVIKLSEGLKVNRTLKQLCLSTNQIGDDGAGKLAEALKMNRSLQTLDLSLNLIEISGMEAFAEVLKVDKSLQMMYSSVCGVVLSSNLFTRYGVEKLINVLKGNQVLQQVDLGGITEEYRVLTDILNSKRSFESSVSSLQENKWLFSNFYSPGVEIWEGNETFGWKNSLGVRMGS